MSKSSHKLVTFILSPDGAPPMETVMERLALVYEMVQTRLVYRYDL